MGRVLVVSRNPGLGMSLSAGEHELVEVRPVDFDLWLDDARDEQLDAVVLDVTDPDAVLHTITELRGRAQMAPVLVVPGTGSMWDDHRLAELPAAVTLPRPITAALLLDAVDRVVRNGSSSLLVTSVPDGDGVLLADGADGIDGIDGNGAPLRGTRATDPKPTGVPEPVAAAEPREPEVPVVPSAVAAVAAVAPTDSRRRAHRSGSRTGNPVELVRSLLSVSDELYGVVETAEVVVANAVEIAAGQAGALLLPDGRRWRVAAGVGMRPLEHRYELTAEDWLVTQVVGSSRAVVLEDTDIVRLPLRGSPLASWHHLVAVPVPRVDGVLLLARAEDPGFTADHVDALGDLAIEAAPLLAAGVDTRTLARRIASLRDEPDTTAPA